MTSKETVEIFHRNKRAFHEQKTPFYFAFKRPLSDFWQGTIFGFDLFKFEDELCPDPGDDLSLNQRVARDYGADAAAIIQKLATL